jgi:hypothetical protein
MPKTVIVDFWDVVNPRGQAFDLTPVIRAAGTQPLESRMRVRGASHTDYLIDVHEDETARLSGTCARIRNMDWPERVNTRTGAVTPLQLPPDEAIAEEMSFHFDGELQVLATQRHRYFRASVLIDLLRDISVQAFDIQPKLQRDAWPRFNRMTRIASIELRLRGPAHHPDFSQVIPSMGQFLDDAGQEINAWEVDLTLSMGRKRKESLNKRIVKKIMRSLRGQDNVKSLVARGKRAGSTESEVVDFMRERLVFSGEVEYTGRQLDRSQCRQLLRDAIEEHREYLESIR